MKNKDEIQREIDALETKDDWGTSREIKMLPDLLREDETIKALCSGQKRKLPSGNLVNILLVCTDKRLLMIDKGLFLSKTDDISLKDVTGIERKDGIIFSKIIIRTNSKKTLKLRHIDKAAAQSLCSEVQNGKEVNVERFIENLYKSYKYRIKQDAANLLSSEYDKILDSVHEIQESLEHHNKIFEEKVYM